MGHALEDPRSGDRGYEFSSQTSCPAARLPAGIRGTTGAENIPALIINELRVYFRASSLSDLALAISSEVRGREA